MIAVEEEVLEQYKDIMPDDLPAGMPPARTHEHKIVEEPGAKPVSRVPYRPTPQLQLKQLLASSSTASSPSTASPLHSSQTETPNSR
ncbi:unnamed protein product, partial [Closterium sp. NIES-54]